MIMAHSIVEYNLVFCGAVLFHGHAYTLTYTYTYVYVHRYVCVYSYIWSGVWRSQPPPPMVWSGTGWGGGGWRVRRGVGAVGTAAGETARRHRQGRHSTQALRKP